jgi:hypothetical protein
MSENKNAKTPADDGKPVAWQFLGSAHFRRKIPAGSPARHWDPLYAAPPKREWVGLSAEEIQEIHLKEPHWGNFACAIEAKLREKNHG